MSLHTTITTTFQGTPKKDVQTVTCDATQGIFQQFFRGVTTYWIPYSANASKIAAALQTLPNIDSVEVSFTPGVSQACFQRNNLVPSGGFLVTFISTLGITGDLPEMTGYTRFEIHKDHQDPVR